MITPNHGLSGYICGRAIMPLLRRVFSLGERSMGWAFFLGAMLPDIDILTKVIGGRGAYFSEAFYAHRHASHSLLGGAVLALIATVLLYRPLTNGGSWRWPWGSPTLRPWLGFRSGWRKERSGIAGLALCFWLGTILHLVGDFFTPGWPLPILWPYPERWGGLSHIGWFTPYLLWLFVATITLTWVLDALRKRGSILRPTGKESNMDASQVKPTSESWWKPGNVLTHGSWVICSVAVYRWVDFMVTSRYESSSQWYFFQQQLLPEAMIVPVTDGVSMVWYWLTG